MKDGKDECIISVLPDGEIRLHQWRKPRDALKQFGALIKSKKSIRRIKNEIIATAMEQVEVD